MAQDKPISAEQPTKKGETTNKVPEKENQGKKGGK